MLEKTIKVAERDLYVLLISEFRYAIERDNHLAPFTFRSNFEEYIGEFSESYKNKIINEIRSQIAFSLSLKDYEHEEYWKDFAKTLEDDY